MNRRQLVRKLSKDSKLTQLECDTLIDCFIKNVTSKIIEGEKVKLEGFGTFSKKTLPERSRWNPITKTHFLGPKHSKPVFNASKIFKEKVR